VKASVLTQKIGPLPAWAWGGLAAVAAWYFLLRGRTSSSSTPNAATSGSQLSSGYGLGYAQGLQAAQATPSPGAGQAPGLAAPIWSFGAPPSGSQTVWRATDTGKQNFQRTRGGQWPGGVNIGIPDPSTGAALGEFGWQWAQVPAGSDPGSYAAQLTQGGMGGPGRPGTARKHAIGSRSAALWHDAHPLVGAKVLYPHYVNAVGGPGNHRNEVHRVARQAGVHPARIMMLNPEHTGRIRIA